MNNGIEGFRLSGGNLFRDLDIGIDLINSTFYFLECSFENCQDINGFDLGYGIRSISSSSISTGLRTITGFMSASDFNGCRYGISTNKLKDVFIKNTEMTAILAPMELGIQIVNTKSGGSIFIEDNKIEGFDVSGIRMDDNTGTNSLPVVATIEGNEISSTTSSTSIVSGIYVEEPSGGSNLNLATSNGNDISGVQIGIYTTNVTDATIESNDITFNLPTGASDDAIGIFCVNCENALVRDNGIFGNCLAPCTYNTTNIRIRGIAMNNCPFAQLILNNVTECGVGALIYNDSQSGNAVCNSFTNCGVGFGFEDIGLAGTPYGPVEGVSSGSASDNKWFPAEMAPQTVTIGTSDGALVPWYYRDSGPLEYNMLIGLNTGTGLAIRIDIQDVIGGAICNGYLRTDSSDLAILNEDFEALIDSAMLSNDGSILPNWVYSQLESYYDASAIENIKIQDALALTNIIQLSTIDELIQSEAFSYASSNLDLISPINVWEANKIDVLKLLLIASDSMMRDTSEFDLGIVVKDFVKLAHYLTENQKIFLNNMAISDLLTEGEAVTIARAMLDLLIIDGMTGEAARLSAPELKEHIRLYPNPSTDF
ncbi:MAG: hypothetical protein ACI959_002253, partial [Limisphaerales bacterium]